MGFKTNYLKKNKYPYFIAEIGINHNGHINLAKRMIYASKVAGADAVKFQKRNLKFLLLSGIELDSPTGYLSRDKNDIPNKEKLFGTWTYPDKRLEFNDDQFLELWRYAESIGLEFIVSPWEEESVDFLAKNKANVLKLASIDANNYHFCEYIASKRIPTIISTGMNTYDSIQKTYNIFKDFNCPMMFLHCTSTYPCPIEDKNLRCIPIMHNIFDVDIGFSGHGVGFEGTLGAIALGANVIEKHVTLSRKMSGPDQAASLEFGELEKLISMSRNLTIALGGGRKEFLQSEKTLHDVLSKKFVTTCNIKEGTMLTKDKIKTVVIKSESGLLPNRYYDILNRKAIRDLESDHIISSEDFED